MGIRDYLPTALGGTSSTTSTAAPTDPVSKDPLPNHPTKSSVLPLPEGSRKPEPATTLNKIDNVVSSAMHAIAPQQSPPGTPVEDEPIYERIYDGEAGESTDSNIRYAGYGARVRTILAATHRYVAYTSDIGESFRPVAHPYLIKSAYGISWLYIAGDVAHEAYKARLVNQSAILAALPSSVKPPTAINPVRSPQLPTTHTQHPDPNSPDAPQPLATARPYPLEEDWRVVAAQRAVFQSLASMALPAFTIHSVVRYSGRMMKNVKNARLRTFGPVGLGLAVVPALPYLFDEPVEHAVEGAVKWGCERFEAGGAATADHKVGERKEL